MTTKSSPVFLTVEGDPTYHLAAAGTLVHTACRMIVVPSTTSLKYEILLEEPPGECCPACSRSVAKFLKRYFPRLSRFSFRKNDRKIVGDKHDDEYFARKGEGLF